MIETWDTNHEGYRAIFNAALNGFIANKDFHGPVSQGNAQAAVEFASEVVLAAIRARTATQKETDDD